MRSDILTLSDPQAPVQDTSPNPQLSPHSHRKPMRQLHLETMDSEMTGHRMPHTSSPFKTQFPLCCFSGNQMSKLTVRLFRRFHSVRFA